jgi:hypothetical protein
MVTAVGDPMTRPADRETFDRDQSNILRPGDFDRRPTRADCHITERNMTALDVLPTAKDLQKKLALAEAEKAAESARRAASEEAEKKALLDQLSKPSGVSDEVRMQRVAAIIQRAVNNGQTEVFVGKFPNNLCTDHGRAINQAEPGWEKTLTGLPKELYDFWAKHLRERGYRLRVQIVDFPGGMPGDVGVTLSWS